MRRGRSGLCRGLLGLCPGQRHAPVPTRVITTSPHPSPPLVTHRLGFRNRSAPITPLHDYPHYSRPFFQGGALHTTHKTPISIRHSITLGDARGETAWDRGPLFMARFWRAFCTLLGTQVSLSSGFHSQSNGQTERANQSLETVLRCLCAQNPASWSTQLPWAEYAINSQTSAATNLSPFECCLEYQPPLFPSQELQVGVSSEEVFIRRCKWTWRAMRANLQKAVARMSSMRTGGGDLLPPTGSASACGSPLRTSPSVGAHRSLHPGTWGPSLSHESSAPRPSA